MKLIKAYFKDVVLTNGVFILISEVNNVVFSKYLNVVFENIDILFELFLVLYSLLV